MFRGLLLGLFFITVGLSMDLHVVAERWSLTLLLLASLLLGKATIIAGLCAAFRLPLADALRIGLLLAQGGEFAFVLFEAALTHHILAPATGHVLLATVAASMIVTPLLAEAGRSLAQRLGRPAAGDLHALREDALSLTDHVVVAGFGRVGQTVAKVLAAADIPYVASISIRAACGAVAQPDCRLSLATPVGSTCWLPPGPVAPGRPC